MADMMDYYTRGWVKLMRVIVNSRSYDNPNATAAYTHCLLRANIKAGLVKGIFLQRGQFITSVEQFAGECGMSEKQMRTALDMLEADGLIIKKLAPSRANNRANNSKRNGTIITVVDYDSVSIDEKQQGEEQGNKPGEKPDEELGNSIRIRNNNIEKEKEYYMDYEAYKDRPALEGNTQGVFPSSPGQYMPTSSNEQNFVTNLDAKRLAAAFIEKGFIYDGTGRGGLEGYIAQELSAGIPEEYLLEALKEYKDQKERSNRIRNHMAYFNGVLSEVIESHNQGIR